MPLHFTSTSDLISYQLNNTTMELKGTSKQKSKLVSFCKDMQWKLVAIVIMFTEAHVPNH